MDPAYWKHKFTYPFASLRNSAASKLKTMTAMEPLSVTPQEIGSDLDTFVKSFPQLDCNLADVVKFAG